MRGHCASAKSGGAGGEFVRRPLRDLLRGDCLAGLDLRHGIAFIEFGRGESAAVGEEAVELAGTTGERLADHRRAALISRTLAGSVVAVPDDVGSDNALARGRGELRRITGCGGGR